jgi:ribonuclease HI
MIFSRNILQKRRYFSNYVAPAIEIYTDGSCINSGKPNVKGGIGVFFPNSEYRNVSEAYDMKTYIHPPTTRRCELVAIHQALIIHSIFFPGLRCQIFTDSHYAIMCLVSYIHVWENNGWKKTNKQPVLNKDLLVPLNQIYKQNKSAVNIIYVKANPNNWTKHSLNNNVVDALAKRGTMKYEITP